MCLISALKMRALKFKDVRGQHKLGLKLQCHFCVSSTHPAFNPSPDAANFFLMRLPVSVSFCPLPVSPARTFITSCLDYDICVLCDLPDASHASSSISSLSFRILGLCSIHWATSMGSGHRATWLHGQERLWRDFSTYWCPQHHKA